MSKIHLLYGFIIGIIAAVAGSYLFIVLATAYNFFDGFLILKAKGQLGKLITLGAILNLAAFFILLHFKMELMARGVVLATIFLTVITLLL